jgi:hypothetical protein
LLGKFDFVVSKGLVFVQLIESLVDVTYFLGGEAQALAFEVADAKYGR